MADKTAKELLRRPWQERFLPYLIVLPAMALTIGILYPFFLAVYYSFTDYRLVSPERNFVGLANYLDLAADPNFWRSLGLTFLYAALTVMVEIPLGLSLALLLNQEVKGVRFFRFILVIPLMMPPVIAALMWKVIMAENGILNYLTGLVGLAPTAWLANTYALLSIVLIDAWLYTPFCAIILLAGLQSLPREPFESAEVDGASAFFVFRRLTLPMLKPFLILAVLFRSMDSLKMFDLVYATTKGAHSTMLIQLNGYYESFRWYNMGRALAYMMVLWIIVFVVSRILVVWWSRAMQQAAGRVE
jgi:multiple sugar transport system permease protein